MLAGDALKLLKKLNPRLNVWSDPGSKNKAGVWLYRGDGEYQKLWAIEKDFVPDASYYDSQGHLTVAGMHRVITNLLTAKLTTPELVKRYYKRGFFCMKPPVILSPKVQDLLGACRSLGRDIKEWKARSHEEGEVDPKEVEHLSNQIDNTLTPWQREQREQRKHEFMRSVGASSERAHMAVTR